MGVDPRTTALEEINKHDTYIITFTDEIRTNCDDNNKNAWCKKKKGNFIHSIKPHYNKSPHVPKNNNGKEKTTTTTTPKKKKAKWELA